MFPRGQGKTVPARSRGFGQTGSFHRASVSLSMTEGTSGRLPPAEAKTGLGRVGGAFLTRLARMSPTSPSATRVGPAPSPPLPNQPLGGASTRSAAARGGVSEHVRVPGPGSPQGSHWPRTQRKKRGKRGSRRSSVHGGPRWACTRLSCPAREGAPVS